MNPGTKKRDRSRPVLHATFLVLFFFLGSQLALRGIHPFKFLTAGYDATKTLAFEQTRTRPLMLHLIEYQGDGVTVHDPEQAYEGLTALQAWFPDGPQVRLVHMDGHVVHKWKVDPFEIWPDPKHLPKKLVPKTRFSFRHQGLVVLPDGSVVVNVANVGTVKLDKCGSVVWTVDRRTQHSITRDGVDGFWIPANQEASAVPEDLLLPGVSRTFIEDTLGRYENLLLFVDADGKVQREFSVLRALFDGNFEQQLYDAWKVSKSDPTHVNDIEIVTAALAEKIKGVKEGDLLVSIRQLHMLAVFDRETGRIKWHQTGPWVRQHDPDILPQGNILVFNNRPLSLQGELRSNLIEFDPATSHAKVVYPLNDDDGFYTDILGTQQPLPNGNILINESRKGRVFEINSQGRIVWEYVKAYDREYAVLIEMAERYEPGYFTVEDWDCD
jgi:hypothetical protein